jgi:acyl carrier protein|tara:strand:+ start:6516 stop:6764 length:249 start_codon:yes stop_codon:yes gene_type:complete
MNRIEILNQIKTAMTVGLFINDDTIFEMESDLGTDLKLDSLDKIEVKLTIEDHFDIILPEDSFAGDVQTINDAVDLIEPFLK